MLPNFMKNIFEINLLTKTNTINFFHKVALALRFRATSNFIPKVYGEYLLPKTYTSF